MHLRNYNSVVPSVETEGWLILYDKLLFKVQNVIVGIILDDPIVIPSSTIGKNQRQILLKLLLMAV